MTSRTSSLHKELETSKECWEGGKNLSPERVDQLDIQFQVALNTQIYK